MKKCLGQLFGLCCSLPDARCCCCSLPPIRLTTPSLCSCTRIRHLSALSTRASSTVMSLVTPSVGVRSAGRAFRQLIAATGQQQQQQPGQRDGALHQCRGNHAGGWTRRGGRLHRAPVRSLLTASDRLCPPVSVCSHPHACRASLQALVRLVSPCSCSVPSMRTAPCWLRRQVRRHDRHSSRRRRRAALQIRQSDTMDCSGVADGSGI